MPVYDYLCGECGPFTALRPMSEFQAPQPCGTCGAPARRAILTAPAFAAMDGGQRRAHATNERSANAPAQSHGRHPMGCGCCKPRIAGLSADVVAAPAKSFPAARPWMISH